MNTRSKYFVKGLQMNMAGFERLDELFTKARKENWDQKTLKANISLVFDLKGASLSLFMRKL